MKEAEKDDQTGVSEVMVGVKPRGEYHIVVGDYKTFGTQEEAAAELDKMLTEDKMDQNGIALFKGRRLRFELSKVIIKERIRNKK